MNQITITKDILQEELRAGQRPATELLYNRYGGMLYSYILQFVKDRKLAGDLLVTVFSELIPRISDVFDSCLSVYCWLQVEARKIIVMSGFSDRSAGEVSGHYSSLLEGMSVEHRWVFREVFIYGKDKQELAVESGKDVAYIGRLLRECLLTIRKKLR